MIENETNTVLLQAPTEKLFVPGGINDDVFAEQKQDE
jgi:hypothetical protein